MIEIRPRKILITSGQPEPSVRPAYDGQERRFARAFEELRTGIESRAFPGAAVAVAYDGTLIALKAVGNFTYSPGSPSVLANSVWDLASVSKVVATSTMAMLLYERNTLDLEAPIKDVLPEFAQPSDPRRNWVTLKMLLAHSSGLPAYSRLYESASSAGELLAACCAMPLEADPGTRAEYSDIGFILLGAALERIAGEPLNSFCQREVFSALGLNETTFNPPDSWRDRIPPSEDDQRFRHRVVQGEVNDENAHVLGGVAGHAGAFSTVLDLACFGHAMLKGGEPILQNETVQLFTRRQASPPGTSRALGWDTPSQPSQSGRYFSPNSFGHLGFTGTSLWCDPERQLAVAMLTNRTWPDRSSQLIKQVRPKFHDAVLECL